jgi:CheY-like chemotaxis protein
MFDFPEIRVRFVEDNPADVMLIRQTLRDHEMLRVLRVMDASSQAPEVVRLDLNLPKHGGDEIITHVGPSDLFARTQLVVMSSSGNPKGGGNANGHSVVYFRKRAGLEAFVELGAIV